MQETIINLEWRRPPF